MRSMLGAVIAMAVALPVGLSSQAGDASRVLTELKAAAGGADRVAAVRTVTANGVLQRVTPRGTVERTVEVAAAFPDKYVARTQLTDQGNMSIYRSTGFNGDGLINVTDAPPNLAAAGRDRLAMSDRLSAPTPEEQAENNRRILMNGKRDFARFALAMFGGSYDGHPVQLSYVALAESPDGKAHVIAATDAEGFEFRLFIDAAGHRPLMTTWSTPLPRDPSTVQEHRLYYSNFKTVDGLTLPHTIRHAVDGNVTDETTYAEIRINPEIDPRIFEVSR